MKKRLVCSALTLALLAGSVSAAFSDITNPDIQQAAAVLDALGIMQGEGSGRFSPSGQLTRAQFCKLAVTALGVDDVSAYQNYSLYPDVPASHWASGYINAARKQSDLREKEIIRGFADGTFGPDQPITYGEVCTMLLRMLGFTVQDIGAMWPADYISKAEALKLNHNLINAYGPNDIVQRGDAAILLLNTLQAQPKEGPKLLLKTVSANTIEDSVLLSTAETDSDLRTGQARFYENGNIQTRPIADGLDASLIGTRGTVLFDKISTEKVRAFVPDSSDSDIITVKEASPTEITATDGHTYKIPRTTTVVIGSDDPAEYGSAYVDLYNRTIRLYYDSGRQIELITSSTTQATGSGSFLYGTTSSLRIPNDYKIIKNGAVIEQSQLKQYDMISLDAENKTATASDKRITGYLQAAAPSFTSPSKVTVLGKEFPISENVARYFEGMKYNDKITLLLDDAGTVQAAFPASKVSTSNVGWFVSSGDGGASIQLLAGVAISGSLGTSEDSYLLGRLVSVTSTSSGKLSLAPYTSSSKVEGDWSIPDKTLGKRAVSPNVKIYEAVADNAPIASISDTDIHTDKVPSSSIRSTILDSSGTVTAILLDDFTGLGWQYGLAYGSSDSSGTQHTVTFVTSVNGESAKNTFSVNAPASGLSNSPVGLPSGMSNITGTVYDLPVKKLSIIASVGVDAFDGSDGVKTSKGYLTLPDDVAVYVPDYSKMIPLREAKVNFKEFTLYGDSDFSSNHMVRLIFAK